MNENELHERYIRLAFQYESAIDALLARGLVNEEAADAAKERFYDTLNEEKLRTTQKVRVQINTKKKCFHLAIRH